VTPDLSILGIMAKISGVIDARTPANGSTGRYTRMDPSHFKALSQLVAPIITRRNTNFQDSISVDERLAVTLRFLATGILKHYSILAIKVFAFCFTYRPT
jgi:hypothetical protein